jgi:hypothetical protein
LSQPVLLLAPRRDEQKLVMGIGFVNTKKSQIQARIIEAA